MLKHSFSSLLVSATCSLLLLLSGVAFGEEQHMNEGGGHHAQECISPVALQQCIDSLQESERGLVSRLQEKEHSVIEEWRNKLNVAVETAKSEQAQSLRASLLSEWEQVSKEKMAVLEREWMSKVQASEEKMAILEREWMSKVQALESQIQRQLQSHETQLLQQAQTHESKLSEALKQEREAASLSLKEAVTKAVNDAKQDHDKVFSKMKQAHSTIEKDYAAVQQQVVELKQSYQRSSSELLQARKDLLKANEIVRLYNARWYNRWIVWPVKSYGTWAYQNILIPVGQDIYIAGKPVLDPFNHQVVEPFVLPSATWIIDVAQDVWDEIVDISEYAWKDICLPIWNDVCEETPIMLQAAGRFLYPPLSNMASIGFNVTWKAGQQAYVLYQKHVEPKVTPFYLNTILPFYQDKLLPIWNKSIVPQFNKWMPVIRKKVDSAYSSSTSFWRKTLYPTLKSSFSKFQTVALGHWTNTAIVLANSAKKYNFPPALKELTFYMAKNPQRSLKQAILLYVFLFIIPITILILRRLMAPRPPKGPKKAPPKKQAKDDKKNNNGVHLKPATYPTTTPSPNNSHSTNNNNNHHNNKKKNARKGTK